MNLTHHFYLKEIIQDYLKDPDGEFTDEFFKRVYNYITLQSDKDFGSDVVTGMDLMEELKSLDDSLVERGLELNWQPIDIKVDYPVELTQSQILKVAAAAMEGLGKYRMVSRGLFYFQVLATMLYGGVYDHPSRVIDGFPVNVYDGLRYYVTAKKLEKEFTSEEVELAKTAVTKSINPIDRSAVPPFADPSAIVKLDGEWYLTDDLLRSAV